MADERALTDLPIVENWKLQKSMDFYKEFALEFDDAAWDLTKGTITLQVDDGNGASKLTITATISTPKTAGLFSITITAAQMALAATADAVTTTYSYGIKLVLAVDDVNFAAGATFLLQKGDFVVESNVFA